MGVFIKKYTYKGKVKFRSNFYGTYGCHGQQTVKLCKIMGNPPASLSMKDEGDAAYERSRQKALDMLQEHSEAAHGRTDQRELIRKAIRIQSGQDYMERKISELSSLNQNRRRMKPPTNTEMKFQNRVFEAFTKYSRSCGKEFLWEIDQDVADEYFKLLQKKYAMTTISKHIFALSGAFKRFAPPGQKNPFAEISSNLKAGKKAFPLTPHRPLTEEQSDKLIAYARNDKLLYPIVICCMCGGLRLGDAATLRFTDILWDKKIIHRKQNKTGEIVNVPFVPLLEEVLELAKANRHPEQEYVFPDVAKKYSPNDPTLCTMGKRLIAKALFDSDDSINTESELQTAVARPSPIEIIKLVDKTSFQTKRKERIYDVYSRYYSGQSYRQIEKETRYSRSQISEDLATVEKLSGKKIRPTRKAIHISELIEKTQEKGTSGKNKRSIYGWHSLRATYVVLALLKYGIPLEVVRQNCGHTTVEMTLKYFNPTADHIYQMIAARNIDYAFTGWTNATTKHVDANPMKLATEILGTMTEEQKALLKALL